MSSRRGVVLVILLILAGLFVSVAGLIVMSLFAPTTVSIPLNATLYLKVSAPYPEVEPSDVFSQLADSTQTLRATVNAIRRAKTDTRVRTMVVLPQSGGALWAQAQEIRAAIEDFRTSGKPVTAYLEAGGGIEYYIASAADRVVLMPAGQLDLVGLATYELFFRGALDKLGVFPDMLHIGDYKTASNTFTEKGFTPAHREMSASLNRDWYDELVRGVAAGRKLQRGRRPPRHRRRALSRRRRAARPASWTSSPTRISSTTRRRFKGTRRLDGEEYVKAEARGRRIVSGATASRCSMPSARSRAATSVVDVSAAARSIGSDTFVNWIRKVRIDPAIRAVVVRIDSPGGSAIASEVIWRELNADARREAVDRLDG